MENSGLQKRVKELRIKQGLSQEELSEKTGLSLRTIQRIENEQNVPRGDTLKRLAVALQVSPDDIIDWQIQEDKNVMKLLNLAQLGFLAFPILGVLIPMGIWILKKDKIKNVDYVGKSIINFQITWNILFFSFSIILLLSSRYHLNLIPFAPFGLLLPIVVLYFYNLLLIIVNTILVNRKSKVKYFPAIIFLH